MPTTLTIGKAAERKAEHYLRTKGFKLITRNFRCRMGEIDLIMLDKQCLVFIEVRMRRNQSHGSGLESVTLAKQKKLIKTAEYFLQMHPESANLDCRFDVVAIGDDTQLPLWIRDAFGV